MYFRCNKEGILQRSDQLIYIDNHWEPVSTLDECMQLVREYNEELASKIEEMLPKHTDEEYDVLEEELEKTTGYLQDAEDEVDKLQEQIDDLNEIIYDLEHGE